MTLEEANARIIDLEEQVKNLTLERDNYVKDNEAKDIRIKDLEGYNQKLFLKASATYKKPEEQEEKFESKLLGKYADLLNNEEIEILKQFEEEIE